MIIDTLDKEKASQRYKRLQYDFILEKLYGITSVQKREWIQSFINPDTVLDQMLPLHMFEGKGFTILTFTDVTPQHALEQMSKLVSPADLKQQAATTFQHIHRLLQTIVGNAHHQFGILPFPMINNRPAVLYESHSFSIVAKACMQASVPRGLFISFVNHFLKWPQPLMYPAFAKKPRLPNAILKAFVAYGAVDIRNSTVEQTKALHDDLQIQLKLLTETLHGINSDAHRQQIQDAMHICNHWRQIFSEFISTEEEIRLHDFLKNDAHEYTGYIHELQQQNTLLNNLEFLDLEELQGVSGLKALRVGVRI